MIFQSEARAEHSVKAEMMGKLACNVPPLLATGDLTAGVICSGRSVSSCRRTISGQSSILCGKETHCRATTMFPSVLENSYVGWAVRNRLGALQIPLFVALGLAVERAHPPERMICSAAIAGNS
jgi:hypothetical protein